MAVINAKDDKMIHPLKNMNNKGATDYFDVASKEELIKCIDDTYTWLQKNIEYWRKKAKQNKPQECECPNCHTKFIV